MRYRIEYADGRCCNFANSRKDLLDWLKLLKDEQIVDIRKIYKSGVIDWISGVFSDVESEMRGIEWGRLFETYHNQPYDPVEAGSGT